MGFFVSVYEKVGRLRRLAIVLSPVKIALAIFTAPRGGGYAARHCLIPRENC